MREQHVEALCIGGPLHGEWRVSDKFTIDVAIPKNGMQAWITKPDPGGAPKPIELDEGWYKLVTETAVGQGFGQSMRVFDEPCWLYMGLKNS
jgi:hypothetical protein